MTAGINFGAGINIFMQVPPEYVAVAGEQYYISERPLSWSQAQYNCMSREGEGTHITKCMNLKMVEGKSLHR